MPIISLILQMNIVVGDSRCRGLAALVPDVEFVVRPGGSFSDFLDPTIEVLDRIGASVPERPHHVYILCGVLDMVSREWGEWGAETIVPNSLYFPRIVESIDALGGAVRSRGAVPVFATITPMNIAIYNEGRMKWGFTKQLEHQQEYPAMHRNHLMMIDRINTYILEYNFRNIRATPLLHVQIRHSPRGKNGRYVYRWHYLSDGLHLTHHLLIKWARCLKIAISKNSRY